MKKKDNIWSETFELIWLVKFIAIYVTKKLSYFISNKDTLFYFTIMLYTKLFPLVVATPTSVWHPDALLYVWRGIQLRSLRVQWADIFQSVIVWTCSILCYYRTSSRYSTVFLYLPKALPPLKALLSIITEYCTWQNLIITTFLLSWKRYPNINNLS